MRLIDADALLLAWTEPTDWLNREQVMRHYTWWQTILKTAPTIDAVPVVRCKDCKWWNPHGKETPASIPALGECLFKGRKFGTACWEFCFWGERKDDEHSD